MPRAIQKITLVFIAALSAFISYSQNAPQAMSYQALARGADGIPLLNQEVALRFGIRQDAVNGSLIWQEEHISLTDDFGLFNLNIGEGLSTGAGTAAQFENINWSSGTYFLEVELENEGGSYLLMGITQLLTVPYAFHANTADLATMALNVANVDDADADPTNELISEFTFENDSLSINEAGTVFVADLGPRLDELAVGQSINLLQLIGDTLNIVEGSNSFILDLSPIADDGDWLQTPTSISHTNSDVGVGTNAPSSTFDVEGSVSNSIQQLVGPVVYGLTDSDHIILANVSTGNVQINLPSATTCEGRSYRIKTMGPAGQPLTSSCTISPVIGESIENETTWLLNQFNSESVLIVSDGSNWWIISQ